MASLQVQFGLVRERIDTMSQTDTRSLQQIKRETELTRAGLTDTVEQLRTSVAETASDIRQRISPEAIKAEVSDYIRSRGEQLMADVTAAARRNPMQAVAIGASVAYPLLRIARGIPLPVLMVGAGLFFAGSKTGQAASHKATDMASDLSDEVRRRAHDISDQAGESAAAAKTFVSDNLDRLRDSVSGGTDQVSKAADQVNAAASRIGAKLASGPDRLKDTAASLGVSAADQVTDLKDRTIRAVGSAASSVQDMASDATSAARRVAGATADAGLNAAKTARETAADLTGRAGKTFLETIEQNPLVVAGVGLLLGGLIASALPRSDIEDGLIGDASSSLKKRAEAAASQGIEAAKDAVGDVYDKAARQAEAEGITPDALGHAAQDIGQRVRRVAESAVATAFEPQNQPQNDSNGVRDHG
jgi:gas vesicle protein